MRRDPSGRHESAAALLADLKAVASGTVVPARRRARAPGRGGKARIRSLAVLPLDNLSGDASQDFFADGMTEALIASLARIEGLRVISRTSAMRFKGVRRPLPEIAAELGVDGVIEGSVARSGERVRITAELIHAASDTHLWGESFDRDLSDVLTLQSEAARAIADQIRIKLTPKTRARLAESRRVNPEAYDAFLRGRFYANRRTEDSLRRGREFLNDAIAKDPTYALAHVGLADVNNLLGYFSYQAPGVAFPRAKAAARYALELDPQLGEAHTSLGYAHLYHDWDWAASEREFLLGIELSPSYLQAHLWYLNVLTARRRFEEALAQGAKCLELDPLSLIANLSIGWVLYFMREYARSAAEFEKGREMDPTFAPTRLNLGWTYLQMGRHAEAVGEFEAAAQLAAQTPTMVLTLAHGVAAAGDRARARVLLDAVLAQDRERYVPSYLAAIACEALGERERAWEWLERAVAERSHWLVMLDLEPRFDPFRDDPRWGGIRRAVGV
jgi:TolB-like protein/Tfp pilus assembly protein PilF